MSVGGRALRPREEQPYYGAHLGDATYWEPYVIEALTRHRLPLAPVEAPFVGTFPTFLVGGLVVKLFGQAFDGQRSYAVELDVHTLLAGHEDIPATKLVATGPLFDDEPRWPYLVTTRLAGTAIREVELGDADSRSVAREVGEMTSRLHQLPAPSAVRDRGLLPGLRGNAVERLTKFGLPGVLIEQVPSFLEDALPPTAFVHADLTADHLFIDGGRLVGVIDWGDAVVAHPYYELVALFFDAFSGRRALWEEFLDAYGWKRDEDFPRRALQAVLEFQFNPIPSVSRLVDIDDVRTLDELAIALFR